MSELGLNTIVIISWVGCHKAIRISWVFPRGELGIHIDQCISFGSIHTFNAPINVNPQGALQANCAVLAAQCWLSESHIHSLSESPPNPHHNGHISNFYNVRIIPAIEHVKIPWVGCKT